ncbi:MAG: hypothetical protein ABSG08_22650, partial [Terriglobales bacterium]
MAIFQLCLTCLHKNCQLTLTGVSVEKVPQLMLVAGQCSGYKQARVRDAAVERYIRRPAAH